MTEHTKTPWGIDKDPDTGELYLYGSDVIDPTNGEVSQPVIATLSNNSPVDDVNAAHIVTCVNAHDELVAMLEKCADYYDEQFPNMRFGHLQEIRDLLAKLKGT